MAAAYVMTFGKYKGQEITNIPTEYLLWVCKEDSDKDTNFPGIRFIRDELKHRRIRLPILALDEHALQRAGERLQWLYQEKKKPNESLNQWLHRVFDFLIRQGMAGKKLKTPKRFKHSRYEYRLTDSVRGYTWKFVTQGNDVCQRLITLYPPGVADKELA